MPYDSQGTFTRVMNWEQDRINDIEIVSDRHDAEDDNFAAGFNLAMCRDGRSTATGNFKMGNFKITGMANGASSNDAVNKGQLDSVESTLQTAIDNAVASASVFVGDIKASLQTANHGNWLLCDGSAVSRTTYADLFALIGDGFGEGDGATTFNLPDYRGKFLRGLGGDSEADVYTTQAEGLPNITGTLDGAQTSAHGTYQEATGAFSVSDKTTWTWGHDGAPTSSSIYRDSSFDASRSSAIYGASSHVTPINQAVNYFIRAKV